VANEAQRSASHHPDQAFSTSAKATSES
jgi:hypothetical protein